MATYGSYKDSGVKWLGQIPSHWDVKKLRSFFSEVKEVNLDCKFHSQLQFKYGTIIPKSDLSVDSDVLATISKYTVVKPNDIVINGLNLNYDFISFRVGKVNEIGVITSAYIAIRPREEISPKYYEYLLKAMDAQKVFHGFGTGIRATLSYKELKHKLLPIVPKNEQKAIVVYLDKVTGDIDRAIEAQQKLIDALNERKQIIITNAVTRGLNPDVPLRDSGIDWLGQIPQHWEIKPLKTICQFGQSLNITKADLTEEGYPVVNYGQIHSKANNRTSLSDELIRFVPEIYRIKNQKCICHKNDMIVADTSEDLEGCGNMVFVDSNINPLAGYHTYSIKNIIIHNPKFLAYLVSSDKWRFQIRRLVNAVKVYTISKSILKQSLIWIPSPSEQDNIVNYLDNKTQIIDSLITSAKKMITLLQERKQIIINEVVTGKKKVI